MSPLNNTNSEKVYTDGKYSVYNISSDDKKFRRVVCKDESICIIPFTVSDSNQIQSVYLSKYQDYLNSSVNYTCISKSINKNFFESYTHAVESILSNLMGITKLDVNDIYYLGKINHGVPFTKEYRCFGVNLSDIDLSSIEPVSKDQIANSSIEKVKFSRVVRGESPDSLVLSSSMLLLSYFS